MDTPTVVAKFGGSSLADASQFEKVAAIVRADPCCRFVVVSAPGARYKGDPKVTDLLIGLQRGMPDMSVEDICRAIFERFDHIVDDLGLPLDLEVHLRAIAFASNDPDQFDFLKSRGEYLSAKILAKLLGWRFLDAADFIRFDSAGLFDREATQVAWSGLDLGSSCCVIPGFYGALPDGTIKTFPRGWSDVSGAIVAMLAGAACYKNWTDVSGVCTADPRIVPDARPLDEITFEEVRELAYSGAQVLHHATIAPLFLAGIPIRLLHTNRPEDPGTLILPDSMAQPAKAGTIAGVAGRPGFTIITVKKLLMNPEWDFLYNLLGVFARRRIGVEQIPGGIDVVSVVVESKLLDGVLSEVLDEIQRVCRPDDIQVLERIALVCVVGRGMAGIPGVAAHVLGALAYAGISARVIVQGASEISMTIGVDASECDTAIRAIHAAVV